ncbi:hypothetical protein [Syntrophothermus sp.]|uniref:hypothetical protein n=1 Tax=Syntrophothermus sp. TaxID=2736299 RepID=UPI0025807AC2|nr:hypothetical protein [Syntrophothermus sp.]
MKAIGLDLPPIRDMLPTVIPVAEVKEERIDFLFRLEDGSLLHLEFQTTAATRADMERFAGYDLKLLERYREIIRTVVIYSGRVKEAPVGFDGGSLVYRVTNVYLKSWDGEKEYEYLRERIDRGEELSRAEIVRLIFLPLMKHDGAEGEVAIKAAELAKRIRDEKQNLVFAAIIALSDRYMTEAQKKRLLEVVTMTQIEQWIREEGRKEGRIEGKIEGERQKALNAARVALKKGIMPEDVAEITGLSLDEVLAIRKEMGN